METPTVILNHPVYNYHFSTVSHYVQCKSFNIYELHGFPYFKKKFFHLTAQPLTHVLHLFF